MLNSKLQANAPSRAPASPHVACRPHTQPEALARNAVPASARHGEVQPARTSDRRSMVSGLLLAAGATTLTQPARAELQPVPAPAPQPATTKTASGILVQVVLDGSGPQPQKGDTVLIDYVLRRSNGYFIYSTVEGVSFQPKDLPVGPVAFKLGVDDQWIPGVQELVSGMKQGGKIRALIPPGGATGYQNCEVDQPQPPTYATKRQLVNHCREPLLFEIALLRVTPGRA